ncbi:hypothetical protein H8958_014209 [Nasalis larvatus]
MLRRHPRLSYKGLPSCCVSSLADQEKRELEAGVCNTVARLAPVGSGDRDGSTARAVGGWMAVGAALDLLEV